MAPDPRRSELEAGHLRLVCVGGHERYEAVPPLLTPERARNDRIIEAWIARRRRNRKRRQASREEVGA
jgi:hypothetical protein